MNKTTTKSTKTSKKTDHTKKKHQYGVCTKWNTPSESHHLILHLRIQPSVREAEAESKDAELVNNAESVNDILQYRPELNTAPSAYEEPSSESCPLPLLDCDPTSVESEVRNELLGTPLSTKNEVKDPMHINDQGIHKVDGAPAFAHTDPVHTDAQTNDAHGSDAFKVHCMEENTHCCWWCTCAFAWTPFGVPLCKDNTGKYKTAGVFCSPECAAAYIFGKPANASVNNYVTGDPWKHYEMLHRLVNINKEPPVPETPQVEKVVRIKLAPPKETLKKFGGPYSVEQYRKVLTDYRVDIRITMPPVNPINAVTEEIPVDYIKQKKRFVPIDTSRVEKATKELRLKRKKRQSEENTLERFMQLRIN